MPVAAVTGSLAPLALLTTAALSTNFAPRPGPNEMLLSGVFL